MRHVAEFSDTISSVNSSYNEEQQRRFSAKIAAVAQQIISGKLGIVAGARELARLRFDIGTEHDSDFKFFVGVDSETDHLPLGDARSRWTPEALKTKDAELAAYESRVRQPAYQNCRKLVCRYAPLLEYDTVRISRLLSPSREYSGTEGVKRPPQIGDEAVICHEYEPDNPAATMAVEMVDREGNTIWLADFAPEELELVRRHTR